MQRQREAQKAADAAEQRRKNEVAARAADASRAARAEVERRARAEAEHRRSVTISYDLS